MEKIKELEEYFNSIKEKKDKYDKMNNLKIKCDSDLDEINDILDKVPD